MSPGEWITASGERVNDRTHGQQFRASFIRTAAPSSVEGIEKYLGSGMIRGIGPVYARKLVRAFGEKVFDVIEAEPDRLREVTGIGKVRAKRITDAWAEQKVVREIMVFLRGHGVGTARAVRIFRTYGVDAVEVMTGNPYRLARDIRWTRNNTGLGLVNSDAAEVALVRWNRVAFRLSDGRMPELGNNDPLMRHLDHARDSTVHAFQGGTVDNVIAVVEAKHPKLSTQKSFHVEISRARHNAGLVTDDAKELRETQESATGERVSALEGIGAVEKAFAEEKARGGEKERGPGLQASLERPAGARDEAADRGRKPERDKVQGQERTAELDKTRGSRGAKMEMCSRSSQRSNRSPRNPDIDDRPALASFPHQYTVDADKERRADPEVEEPGDGRHRREDTKPFTDEDIAVSERRVGGEGEIDGDYILD